MLNKRAKIIRVVNIDQSMEVTVDTDESPKFWIGLTPPKIARSSSVDSPRDASPYTLRFAIGEFAPLKDVQIGTWIDLGGTVYEVTSNARILTYGPMAYQKEVERLPVSDLYPLKCAIVKKAEPSVPAADKLLALWGASEDTRDHGQYATYLGYLDITAHPLQATNVEVVVGDTRYTISRSAFNLVAKTLDVTLRTSGRS